MWSRKINNTSWSPRVSKYGRKNACELHFTRQMSPLTMSAHLPCRLPHWTTPVIQLYIGRYIHMYTHIPVRLNRKLTWTGMNTHTHMNVINGPAIYMFSGWYRTNRHDSNHGGGHFPLQLLSDWISGVTFTSPSLWTPRRVGRLYTCASAGRLEVLMRRSFILILLSQLQLSLIWMFDKFRAFFSHSEFACEPSIWFF